MKKHIEVVAAVIKHNNKYFVAQRKDQGELSKKWEFPGGKIDLGETRKGALLREIKEELKANITIVKHLKTINHEYNTFNLTLHAYLCNINNPSELVLTEHLDSKWLTEEELTTLDWAAADIPIVNLLRGN